MKCACTSTQEVTSMLTMCRSQITRDLIDGNTSVAPAPMPGATVENVVNMTGQNLNSLARASYLKHYDGTQIKTVFAPGEYTIPRFDACLTRFLPEPQSVLHQLPISMVLCQNGKWFGSGAMSLERESMWDKQQTELELSSNSALSTKTFVRPRIALNAKPSSQIRMDKRCSLSRSCHDTV